jgi:hypothetical protein
VARFAFVSGSETCCDAWNLVLGHVSHSLRFHNDLAYGADFEASPRSDGCNLLTGEWCRSAVRQEGRDAWSFATLTLSSDQRSGSLSEPITRPVSSADIWRPTTPNCPPESRRAKVEAQQLLW